MNATETANKPTETSYALLTDAPPRMRDAHGISVLTWNWIQAVSPNLKLVITRRCFREVELGEVRQSLPVPVSFYPDLARWRGARRLGWLKPLTEIGLFCLAASRIKKEMREAGVNRIFAFFGAELWFLFVADMLARQTGLPMDIYLVDDLEASAAVRGERCSAELVRRIEPRVLRRAARTYVISEGFSEHVKEKYAIDAFWLPVCFRVGSIVYQPFKRTDPDVREIVVLGSVNPLYVDALNTFFQTVAEWNAQLLAFRIKVVIMTYSEPSYVRSHFGRYRDWKLVHRADNDTLHARMRQAWALLLPYSFDPSVRVMVSTSFPSRLSECVTSGRPLLVFGPPYASLPRYFRENGLPLCAQSASELKTAFGQIDAHDSPELIDKYTTVLMRHHSPEAIRRRLIAQAPCDCTKG